MKENLPEDGGDVTEVGETAQDCRPGVRRDGLEDGLGQHSRVVESLHDLDDVILVLGHRDDDGIANVDNRVDKVEDVDKLLGAWWQVLGGERRGVLVVPQEVEEPPGEIHLDLLVLQVPGVLHRLGADQTSPATDSPELAHAAGSRHPNGQIGSEE